MPAVEPAIEVVGVSHVFIGQTGPVQALAPLDLQVEPGSFVAILGPSGCGKTTLLRILSGLLEPTAGHIRLAGAPPPQARRRRAIGWLAQEDGLLPWRNVADNVGLALRLAGTRPPAADLAVLAVLDMLRRVGLPGSARQYPHELSGGMRQRVALARALLARPPFLLLDEPFAHLDELTRERLGDLVLALRAEAAVPPTTVLVTHSVHEAVRLADRVVVLSARPARLLVDQPITLARPRQEDDPGVGRLVRHLKGALFGTLSEAVQTASAPLQPIVTSA